MPVASPPDLRAVDSAARALLRVGRPVILAVSGGCDSMVLMHAVARARRRPGARQPARPPATVVTFDHGTGPASAEAAALVVDEGRRLGLVVRAGRGSLPSASEAEWRAARWRFLRAESAAAGAIVATAHTLDDQLETMVMRVLRGAGARGIAGLAAPANDVARPFLHLPRGALRHYAATRGVAFVEDPSNASLVHLRNRVRLDLLPSIARVRPEFAAEMLALADRAAAWRLDLDALAPRFVRETADPDELCVARDELTSYDSAALAVLWPAIAARAGVTLDRRGTLRLAQFTISGAPGARIQLSGRIEVFRHRDSLIIRREPPSAPTGGGVPLAGPVQFGRWRFSPVSRLTGRGAQAIAGAGTPERRTDGARSDAENAWTAVLPGDRPLWVRAWQPGDRMRSPRGGAARRVKRYFADERVPGPTRTGWPVVLADDEIVWIPGVRRADAAPERSGRPPIRYLCEWFDGDLPDG